jgi:hypothetical protein
MRGITTGASKITSSREGFQELVAQVALGRAGLILGR